MSDTMKVFESVAEFVNDKFAEADAGSRLQATVAMSELYLAVEQEKELRADVDLELEGRS